MICTVLTKILKNIIQGKKREVLIVFDDITADMINKKNLSCSD